MHLMNQANLNQQQSNNLNLNKMHHHIPQVKHFPYTL